MKNRRLASARKKSPTRLAKNARLPATIRQPGSSHAPPRPSGTCLIRCGTPSISTWPPSLKRATAGNAAKLLCTQPAWRSNNAKPAARAVRRGKLTTTCAAQGSMRSVMRRDRGLRRHVTVTTPPGNVTKEDCKEVWGSRASRGEGSTPRGSLRGPRAPVISKPLGCRGGHLPSRRRSGRRCGNWPCRTGPSW
jgi:hypothetical protein